MTRTTTRRRSNSGLSSLAEKLLDIMSDNRPELRVAILETALSKMTEWFIEEGWCVSMDQEEHDDFHRLVDEHTQFVEGQQGDWTQQMEASFDPPF